MNTYGAYLAGWDASRRTKTFDLDAAEARFEAKHGRETGTAFAWGWTDYASGYGKRAEHEVRSANL